MGTSVIRVALVLGLAWGGVAHAQPSNFGTLYLTPGFTPDPASAAGTSGGALSATNMGAQCVGWISQRPDHILQIGNHFRWMRIFVESDRDTTLVIQAPNGRMMCSDDAFGRNPAIEGRFHRGTYRVWIGSYSRGENAPYTLRATELRDVRPGSQPPPQYQPVPQGWQSNYGQVTLYPGFTPDPQVVGGTSGGAVAASNISNNCRGWISQTPDHILSLSGYMSWLRIYAESGRDTTLVIQSPQNQVYCDDDTFGRNPSVEGAFGPGMYRIWVGSYSRGEHAPYNLTFTELRHVQPGQVAQQYQQPPPVVQPPPAQMDFSGTRANFGQVQLMPGFSPDPQRRNGTSGGVVSATTIDQRCRGWISPTPDHVLDLRNHFRFFRVFVNSRSDTTLVIRRDDGTFFCNDDANGRNPMIDQSSWRAGRYLIWVGSYQQNQRAPYTIGFTELGQVTR